MKSSERPSSPPESAPAPETTNDDSSPIRTPASGRRCTAEEPTAPVTGRGVGVDSNATVGRAAPDLSPDPTASPSSVDATVDVDRNATALHDPNATAGPDRDATGDYDPNATDGFMLSPAKTDVASQATGSMKGDELPQIAGYEIVRVLGAGGMGIVYMARHLRLDRLVALKMIKAGGGARASDLARFEAEARAVAAIDHPNIEKKLAVAAGRAAIQQNRDVVEAQREMIFKLEDKWRNTPAAGSAPRRARPGDPHPRVGRRHDDGSAIGHRLAGRG